MNINNRTRLHLACLAIAFMSFALLPQARAVNCLPSVNESGNWKTVGWGRAGGIDNGLPGNNGAGVNDAVYLRRSNTITIDSDVSPSTLQFTGGIGSLTIGDGYESGHGSGNLIVTQGGKIRVENSAGTLTTLSIVLRNRDRPNSVGTLTIEKNAVIETDILNVGWTSAAYNTDYLLTHKTPSKGTLIIKDTATLNTTTLTLGTAAAANKKNTDAGFPGTSGIIEITGNLTTINISSAILYSTGTIRLVATESAIPSLSIGNSLTVESGFSLDIDLRNYDAPMDSEDARIPILCLASASDASKLLTAIGNNFTVSGYPSAEKPVTLETDTQNIVLVLPPLLDATGKGVVIDHKPITQEKQYPIIVDPTIAMLPDGSYIAAHTFEGNTTLFRSVNKGADWARQSELENIQCTSLIVHNNKLYILGSANISSSTHTIIRKSSDMGLSWSPAPESTQDSGYITNYSTSTPKPPVVHNGRIYLSRAASNFLSVPLSTEDLTDGSAWTPFNVTLNSTSLRTGWPTHIDAAYDLWSESQITASPQHGITVLPKIQMLVPDNPSAIPHHGHVPHTALLKSDGNSVLAFSPSDGFVPLPGTQKKFGIVYDEVSEKYYALTGTVLPKYENTVTTGPSGNNPKIKHELIRNTATLYSSTDLQHWDLEKIFIHSENAAHDAWQYFNFIIDNGDLAIVSRTSLELPGDQYPPFRGHDSNALTFHRIGKFRELTPEHILKLENGSLQRYESTDYHDAPLGNFVLGVQPANPADFAISVNGTVYIRQQNSEVLSYDSHGNLLGRVNSLPSGLVLSPGDQSFKQTKTSQRTWAQAGSGDWYDPRNWHYWNRPDTASETVTLGSAITEDSTITLNQTHNINGLFFRSENSYIIASGNILSSDGNSLYDSGALSLVVNPDTNDAPLIENTLGHHSIQAPVSINSTATLSLAANTTLSLDSLTLNAPLFLDIDLAETDPDIAPLVIGNLHQGNPASTLTITIRNAQSDSVRILEILGETNLDASGILLRAPNGDNISFTFNDGLISASPPPPPIVIVNEFPTPEDDSRLDWFGSSGTYIDRLSPPGIIITGPHTEGGTNSGLHHLVSNFAKPGYPLSLNIGETLVLSANITPVSTTGLRAANAFRFGLFNSRNQPENLHASDAAPATSTATGYMIALRTSDTTGGTLSAHARTLKDAVPPSKTYTLITHSTAYQNLNGEAVSPQGTGMLNKDQTYTLELKITRSSEDAVDIRASISGGDFSEPLTITANDSITTNRDGAITTEFDIIAFASANNAGLDDMRFTDITLSMPLREGAPSILQHPQDQFVSPGEDIVLSTIANGSQPLAYQWKHEDNPIPDATHSTLLITSVNVGNAGNYTCIVTNAQGSATTEAAYVSIGTESSEQFVFVNEYPQGAPRYLLEWFGLDESVINHSDNALQIQGRFLTGAGTTGLRHALAHFAHPEYPIKIAQGEKITLQFKITPRIVNETVNNTLHALRFGLFNTNNLVDNIITEHSNPGGVYAPGYAGYFHAPGTGPAITARRATPPATLTDEELYTKLFYITNVTPFDSLATRTSLTSQNQLLKDQTYLVSLEVMRIGENRVSITSTLSGGHLIQPLSMSAIDGPNNRDNVVSTEFDTLLISIASGYGLDTADITDIQVWIPEQAGIPVIHAHPVTKRILPGGSAELFVTATGTLPLSYQWLKDGQILAGETTNRISVENADASHDGFYTCVITNSEGSVSTEEAQIAIRSPETIKAPTPASYIGSYMILQRDKPNTIWGTANPGDPITVTLVNTETDTIVASASTSADANGDFITALPPLPYSTTPHTLTIANILDRTVLKDILIGENWLCGGQSNMTWAVGSSANAGAEILDSANYPLLRIYKSVLTGNVTPQENSKGKWKVNTPNNIRSTTAVGYFFCRTLHQTALQGIPVGILDVNRGGSSIEAWMEREALRSLGYEDYANATGDTTHDGAALYNAMVHPVRHASFAGIIWYQGEHNAAKHLEYRKLFKDFINHWRNDVFALPDAPFYFVTLADIIRDVDKTNIQWAWLRYAQLMALELPNTGDAFAMDLGEPFNSHPKNKQDVAYRLALQALHHHYGYTHLEYTGPVAQRASTKGGGIVNVTFTHTKGLFLDPTKYKHDDGKNPADTTREKTPRDLPAFELSPDYDNLADPVDYPVYYPANATIVYADDNTAMLSLSCPEVPNPKTIRYAWDTCPSTPLRNTAVHPVTGEPYPLPANPFIMHIAQVEAPNLPNLTQGEILSYAFTANGSLSGDGTLGHLPSTFISPTSGKLGVSFTPFQDGLLYEVQQSSDLQDWTSIQIIPGGSSEPVSVEATSDAAIDPNLFLRIKVSPAP